MTLTFTKGLPMSQAHVSPARSTCKSTLSTLRRSLEFHSNRGTKNCSTGFKGTNEFAVFIAVSKLSADLYTVIVSLEACACVNFCLMLVFTLHVTVCRNFRSGG